ncbi:ABC1 kinase family protein [Nocardia camponoti]|uniref:ABC transporter ATP-binding protein n=1 Tax=Nocardia camponoti TaxID=1616106 RepID=A0A917VDZ3_9NOCA|nr:AarF/ABC1/UbiB kinase family protein [Nocardia camponoti]GGK66505.1 ABC transporter ATP-binding protein [Nocardia camponoti]
MGGDKGRVLPFVRREHKRREPKRDLPTGTFARGSRLAAVPVMYAGRRVAGFGKRAAGGDADDITRQIRLRTAQHLFDVMGELKGCVAKLGQLLGLLEWGLPRDLAEPYRAALARLHDSAPPMLPGAVHAELTKHLGPHWRSLLPQFDDRAAAAASVGQVHRGCWHDGTPVAVKIMYPGARAAVSADLAVLRRIAPLFGVLLPAADTASVVNALCAEIGAELDYAREAANQRAFTAAFADDPDVVVSRVVAQYGDVLVTEWLDGIPLSHLVNQSKPAARDRVGVLVLRFLLSAPARVGLVYGDAHPGNFLLMPDGRLGIVDFGACTSWPREFLDVASEVGAALLTQSPHDLESAMRRHGFVAPGRALDIASVLARLQPVRDALLATTYPLTEKWLREQVRLVTDLRLTNVLRQLTMPAEHTAMLRSFLGGVAVLCQLHTDVPLRAECTRWYPETVAAAGL